MLLPIFCECVFNAEFIQGLFSEVIFPKSYCQTTYPFWMIEEEYGYQRGQAEEGGETMASM